MGFETIKMITLSALSCEHYNCLMLSLHLHFPTAPRFLPGCHFPTKCNLGKIHVPVSHQGIERDLWRLLLLILPLGPATAKGLAHALHSASQTLFPRTLTLAHSKAQAGETKCIWSSQECRERHAAWQATQLLFRGRFCRLPLAPHTL